MAVTTITRNGVAAIAATSSPTATPTGSTDGFLVPPSDAGFTRVLILIAYSGTVNAVTIAKWIRDTVTGTWYRDASTDDLQPLAPGGASPVNEARSWVVSPGDEIFFTVDAISGGGTVAAKVRGAI